MLSICLVMADVRSSPDAGGKLILANIVPWSSLGTKLDGVVFMRKNKPAENTTTPVITIHFFAARKITACSYF